MIMSKKNILSSLAAAALSFSALAEISPVDYVNPLVGTISDFEVSNGNTYPAIAMPWGMNFWTPQTGSMGDGWTYVYTEPRIKGFKQTHQPSPWMNDYGQFAIMPGTDHPVFDQDKRSSFFTHKAEVAKPYYYSVFLADHRVTTEITPTERAAMFRFTFPANDSSFVVVDAYDRGSYIKVLPAEKKIVGYTTRNSGGVPENFKNYFVVEFDKPFTYTAAVTDGNIDPASTESKADHAGAIIGFATRKGEKVHARVASSFISPEQAELNLRELDSKDFDTLVKQGRDRWNEVLGRIEVESDDTDRLRTFYSCLYRSTLFPRMFHEIDADGRIVHYSPHTGEVCPGRLFTDTGLWDSFRGELPMLNLIYPEISAQMQEGFYNHYKESGFYPEWSSPGHRDCMIGNNSASVVADAFVKGVTPADAEAMYEGLLHGANALHPTVPASGRVAFEEYNTMGYVPSDVAGQSAARTLEYASFKLMSGRDSKGNFPEDFDPVVWWGPFTEGNSWHYTWSVFHDVQGLIDLMGGKKEFTAMLDSVFTTEPTFGKDVDTRKQLIHEMREMQIVDMGQYAHGNQPIQHMIYLYNYGGEPWKAQYHLREVMNRLYRPTPDGYCGDEDNGQTSAWYIMSALGFYTVCPGTDEYVLGAPLFTKARINLPNGKKIEISAPENSDENRYVDVLKLNGKEYGKNYLRHSDLTRGARLDYKMSAKPNYKRGTRPSDAPYSLSNE